LSNTAIFASVLKEIRSFSSFEEAELADRQEWQAMSAKERLRIGEAMREECFPSHEPGLQRVLRVVEREER
jgi:hypothetical protein